MTSQYTAVLVGSTGLVGQNILSTLLAHPSFSQVQAFARRDLPSDSQKLQTITSTDSSEWPSKFPKLSDASKAVFFSGLGTTRGQAGSFEAQRKIDLDLNVAMAKAAKEAGVRTYVLISAAGQNSQSRFPYMKMKGQIEEQIAELGFEHTVFVRPGLIVGSRSDSRPPEWTLQKIAQGINFLHGGLKDFWAQDADVIAKAAVAAGLQCAEGRGKGKVWVVEQKEVLKLGRTEWKA